ncbi:hypothetical protein Pmani_013098 [Petrolisthes manimaculis]|uniref:Uncharacterized protein n=1 Tax=Petrolisthes manimaculis TaxID=1843537 RepID=A0AAE1PWN6_9EUCA|nr:hypothetical protein Pmani_013098 [Petrolisthes manimaculis]
MGAAKWCFVGALLCAIVWLSMDSIEWQVGQAVTRMIVSPLMTGKCPHLQEYFDLESTLEDLISEMILGTPYDSDVPVTSPTNKTRTPPDPPKESSMDGLKAMVHVHPFTWKGEENGKQVYEEDGVIQAQVVMAHGGLFYSLNTSLYTSEEYVYDILTYVGNLLSQFSIREPVPIKLLIDSVLGKLSPGDSSIPHMEMLLQKNYTTFELPAIRVSNTAYTFPPLPELSFTYNGSGHTAAGGITVEQYWTRDLFRKDVMCNFLNKDLMDYIYTAELYNIILSPLDSDPHPLVAAKLSVPAGRALTLDLHPVYGVPVGGRLDLQINMNITDQFSHQTPRHMTVPLMRIRVTVEALPTYLHQILQIAIILHLILKMVLTSIFFVFLVIGLYRLYKSVRHHKKYSLPTSSPLWLRLPV